MDIELELRNAVGTLALEGLQVTAGEMEVGRKILEGKMSADDAIAAMREELLAAQELEYA